MSLEAMAATVAARYPDVLVARGEVSVVLDREQLLEALAWLREEPTLELGFLSSLTATHWPGREPAFWLDYELRSMTLRHRLRVKVGCGDDDARVPLEHVDDCRGFVARRHAREGQDRHPSRPRGPAKAADLNHGLC